MELKGIDWISGIQRQDKRVIARLITHIENRDIHTDLILDQLYPITGKAFVVGVTGPPGVGKSTLVDGVVAYLRSIQMRVAVVAIDPSSPFTGGAILGDRVRMTDHALDSGVFIRSMGSRGKQGGVAYCTREVIHVLDAAGYDVIFVETIGVGQAELDVMNVADSVAVVLHPESGDMVQVLKAGIMEISDLYVINKADLRGADRLEGQIHDMIELVKKPSDWHPPVLKSIAKDRIGAREMWENLLHHKGFLEENGEWLRRRRNNLYYEVREMIATRVGRQIDKIMQQVECMEDLHKLVERRVSPYQVVEKWIQRII